MAIIEVLPQSAVDGGGLPCTLLWIVQTTEALDGVYMDDEGKIRRAPLDTLQLDWRFDHRERKWVDVSPGPSSPEGQD